MTSSVTSSGMMSSYVTMVAYSWSPVPLRTYIHTRTCTYMYMQYVHTRTCTYSMYTFPQLEPLTRGILWQRRTISLLRVFFLMAGNCSRPQNLTDTRPLTSESLP